MWSKLASAKEGCFSATPWKHNKKNQYYVSTVPMCLCA